MTTSSTKSNTAGKQKQQRSKASEEKPKATRQDAYSALKSEINRLAAKAVRQETDTLKKSSSAYRSDIVALKRRVLALEQELKRVGTATAKSPAAQPVDEGETQSLRFSAKGFAKQRHRLGISAAACGALLGVSPLSVYKWESGKARPRAKQLPAIAALRAMGKREASARLAALGH